jgi:hypothetical protein
MRRALAILVAAVFALAIPAPVLASARLSVTIEPGPEPGEFVAAASVRELANDRMIAAPRLAVRAGARAEAGIALPGAGEQRVRFEVTIDPTATRAAWRLEWWRADRVEASSEGSVTLAVAESHGY